MVILSPEEIRAAEKKANDGGLSYEAMMLTAGRGCAAAVASRCPADAAVTVLAGRGKNGGDGFVCARTLAASGRRVSVILALGAPTDPLAIKMFAGLDGVCEIADAAAEPLRARRMLSAAGVIVDAVFGIGFRGAFPPALRALIEAANASSALRFAVDLPSGVGDASEEPSPFRADVTLSMLCYKKEHIYKPAALFCGRTELVPIGFDPPSGTTEALTEREAAALLPARPWNAHKGTFGHVLILGGSVKMPGAAVLAADGALYGGAGLVTVAVPAEILPAVQAKLTAPVFLPLPTSPRGGLRADAADFLAQELPKYQAVVLGNGMGVDDDTVAVTEFVLKNSVCPVILDADGINCVSRHIDIRKTARCPVLLTPHPGEMGRLTGKTAAQVNDARAALAAAYAAESGADVLLKGANTVIASPDGRVRINPTGCAALARGGSGDTLAGLIGALVAQGTAPADAAALGAYVHGRAGEIAEERYSSYAATIQRIAECIGPAFKSIAEGT